MGKVIVFAKGLWGNSQTIEAPKNISCSWIAKNIGCEWIERVAAKRLPKGLIMAVDEEGLLKDNELNAVGSYLYETDKHGQPIAGDVMILKEVMGPEGPEFAGMDDKDISSLIEVVSRIGKG